MTIVFVLANIKQTVPAKLLRMPKYTNNGSSKCFIDVMIRVPNAEHSPTAKTYHPTSAGLKHSGEVDKNITIVIFFPVKMKTFMENAII